MDHSYHDQAPTNTLSVGDLIKRLQSLDPAAPVIFRSPLYGAFGAEHPYPIGSVEAVTFERKDRHTPAGVEIDDETGEESSYQAFTQTWNAWTGVVLTCPSYS